MCISTMLFVSISLGDLLQGLYSTHELCRNLIYAYRDIASLFDLLDSLVVIRSLSTMKTMKEEVLEYGFDGCGIKR